MVEWLERAADPGRVHTEGRMVRAAIEDGREEVAGLLGCRPREVVFTSGGTEAVNAAVWGALSVRPGTHRPSPARSSTPRSARGRVELGPGRCTWLRRRRRRASPRASTPSTRFAGAPETPVALVHCQWGNHEVGTVQPVAEVVERSHQAGALVHVDAVQAAGRVPLDLTALGADLVSVSAH